MNKLILVLLIFVGLATDSLGSVRLFGDRNAHPTYLRMPKFPEYLAYPQAEAHGHIMPSIQANSNFQHYTTSKREDAQSLHYQKTASDARQDEISGYSHMYATSDLYGGLPLQ